MILDCILTACDLNPLYFGFIPIFIKSWKKLIPHIDIKIILIADKIPNQILCYSKYIILFPPIDKVGIPFIALYIRYLYPAILKYRNGVMITDIDMLPMNANYHINCIKKIEDDRFINTRDVCLPHKQLASCYIVATPQTWNELFTINSHQDIITRLKNIWFNTDFNKFIKGPQKGWFKDQIDVYNYAMEWNKKTKRFVCLNDKNTGFRRLDRFAFQLNNDIKEKIKKGYYSDYHAYRPYSQYKELNDQIVELLPNNDFISGEKITGLCDVAIYERKYLEAYPNIKFYCKKIIYVGSINEIKKIIDQSYSFFVKSDWLNYFQQNILPHIKHKFILVTHNSALTVGRHSTILNHPHLVKWYGQNMLNHPKTEGIPLGLNNSSWNKSDYNLCCQCKKNKKENLLYLNFNLHTNPRRKGIYELLKKKGFEMSKKCSWTEYIQQLSTYKFCISPPGAGVDCHRIWEAIYVGCIPIVEMNDLLYPYFKELPILFVKNYNNIDNNCLEEKYKEFKGEKYSEEKTKLSYWYERFTLKNVK